MRDGRPLTDAFPCAHSQMRFLWICFAASAVGLVSAHTRAPALIHTILTLPVRAVQEKRQHSEQVLSANRSNAVGGALRHNNANRNLQQLVAEQPLERRPLNDTAPASDSGPSNLQQLVAEQPKEGRPLNDAAPASDSGPSNLQQLVAEQPKEGRPLNDAAPASDSGPPNNTASASDSFWKRHTARQRERIRVSAMSVPIKRAFDLLYPEAHVQGTLVVVLALYAGVLTLFLAGLCCVMSCPRLIRATKSGITTLPFTGYTADNELAALYRSSRSTRHSKRVLAARDLFPAASTESRANVLSVLVCMFNEEVDELLATLCSLGEQHLTLVQNGWSARIVIALDGWDFVSSSTKHWLDALFPSEAFGSWKTWIEHGSDAITLRGLYAWRAGLCPNELLDLTVYVKRDNRKKDDSLSFFLGGFMPHAMAHEEYALMTDCGTTYNSGCLMTLLLHMIEHPECVGATGHVQVAPNCSWEPQLFDTYESRMLLSAQRAEMAISTVTTFDMTSRFGYMPVLPGPLNIWRMSMLTARPRQAGQKARPEDLDDALTTFGALLAGSKRSNAIFHANMRHAEDMLLTLAALSFSAQHATTIQWVPGAVMYYQAEPSLTSLFNQRRRWNNSAMACHLHVLQNRRLYTSLRSAGFTFCMTFLAYCNVLVWPLVLVQPGILFGFSMISLADIGDMWPQTQPAVRAVFDRIWLMSGVYMFVLSSFVVIHYVRRKPQHWCLRAASVYSIMGNTFIYVTLFLHLSVELLHLVVPATESFAKDLDGLDLDPNAGHFICEVVLCPTTSVIAGPMAFAVLGFRMVLVGAFLLVCVKLRDTTSPGILARNMATYLIFSATYYPWMFIAHASMYHVLTWGNRPDRDISARSMNIQSFFLMMGVLILNAVVVFGFASYGLRFEAPLAVVSLLAGAPLLIMPLMALCVWASDVACKRPYATKRPHKQIVMAGQGGGKEQ